MEYKIPARQTVVACVIATMLWLFIAMCHRFLDFYVSCVPDFGNALQVALASAVYSYAISWLLCNESRLPPMDYTMLLFGCWFSLALVVVAAFVLWWYQVYYHLPNSIDVIPLYFIAPLMFVVGALLAWLFEDWAPEA